MCNAWHCTEGTMHIANRTSIISIHPTTTSASKNCVFRAATYTSIQSNCKFVGICLCKALCLPKKWKFLKQCLPKSLCLYVSFPRAQQCWRFAENKQAHSFSARLALKMFIIILCAELYMHSWLEPTEWIFAFSNSLFYLLLSEK